jgi:hypothetical protein
LQPLIRCCIIPIQHHCCLPVWLRQFCHPTPGGIFFPTPNRTLIRTRNYFVSQNSYHRLECCWVLMGEPPPQMEQRMLGSSSGCRIGRWPDAGLDGGGRRPSAVHMRDGPLCVNVGAASGCECGYLIDSRRPVRRGVVRRGVAPGGWGGGRPPPALMTPCATPAA